MPAPFNQFIAILVGRTSAGLLAAPIAAAVIAPAKGPKYRVKDYPAGWLFQGAFGEMHDRDKAADPAKIAASLGFNGSSWKTPIAGCANELEFHFVDETTAASA